MTDVTQHDRPTTTPSLQPLLHDLASCVAAPALVLASADGQVRPGGVSGWYVGDRRLLDTLELRVAGSALDVVRSATRGADRQEVSYVARRLGDPIPDPTVRLDRVRTLDEQGLLDEVTVESVAQEPVEVVVEIAAATDLAPMSVVKQGGAGGRVRPEVVDGALRWRGAAAVRLGPEAAAPAGPAAAAEVEADGVEGRVRWRLLLTRGERRTLAVRATTDHRGPFASGRPAPWSARVEADDVVVRRTAEQSLADLAGLLMRDGDDRFLAAGSPWFLTLFGRDSLWAARMLVPYDASLALSTLRVLARRQGSTTDPVTEEQPGKVLHEVRDGGLDLGALALPPVYYGSVDATPLFVCTLADAAAWGADPAEVRALLAPARRCLEWVVAQTADDGWLRYVDHTGHGLSNQGWKDSHDSVQFSDGRLADPPIALVEVQAYAHEAAVRGAALLAAHGEPPVPGLAELAEDLRARFAAAYWVEDGDGGHLAIALDGRDGQVDALTSNVGHVLGTGVLDVDRAARLAALLADPRMDSGFGLRTLSTDSPRFSRLSYHGGSVWPHDTVVAVLGLAREGHREVAGRLTRGVVDAAEGFGHRLPELYGGDAATDVPHPAAYPAACRPQAWSAAAPLAALVAVSGVRPGAEPGTLVHPARTSTALGGFVVRGLRLGGESFDVRVASDGSVSVDAPHPLRVEVARDA